MVAGWLVEPLVRRVERGDGHIEDLQLADCSVSAAGLDEDRCFRLERMSFTIEFDMTFAFQHVIDFGHLLVIVGLTVFFDRDHVHGREFIVGHSEGTFRFTARTRYRRDIGELGDHVFGHAFRKACFPPVDKAGLGILPLPPIWIAFPRRLVGIAPPRLS